jgi:arylsulfatase A-like enzyme
MSDRDLQMNRRTFLAGSASSGARALAGSPPAPAGKPDIVFFMVDQLSAKWLWGPAAKTTHTPNFDKLRARGVAFTSACVSNPICCASRATLATGLTTREHGVLQNGYELDPALPTFMRQLQQNGWRTGAFGKLHFHSQYAGVHHDYRPYGFDVVRYTEDARAGNWLDWVEREQPKYYEKALATVWAADIPELKAYGPKRIDFSSRIKEIWKTFRWPTPEFPANTAGRYTLPFPAAISQTEWITRHAEDFIQQSDRGRPLYAPISYVQPHSPFCPPADYMRNVDESGIPAPAGSEWVNDPLHPHCFAQTEGAHQVMPKDWRATRHYYLADLTHLDEQLGRVMKTMEEAGRMENAYLILLSDHGELFLDHGFTGKGERHYDACVRVPLIISGPGLKAGLERQEPAQLEDIFPTVMEMAGLSLPAPRSIGPYLKMPPGAEAYPGKSLFPLCRGEQPERWREQLWIESYNNITSTTPDFWARTVRTRDWRYTLYPGGQGEQLFSLREDPDEQHNLAGDARYSSARRELRDRLLEQVILQDYPHTRHSLFSLGVF